MEPLTCPNCQLQLTDAVYFCPNCGKKIKEPPPSTSLWKQLSIYSISIFLPPFGLVPGIKYFLQKDQKTAMIGLIAIILTVISTILTIWYSYNLYLQFSQLLSTQ